MAAEAAIFSAVELLGDLLINTSRGGKRPVAEGRVGVDAIFSE